MLPGRILKRFYFYMKKTKITWNVAVVSLLLKKKCAQKVYYGWVWSSGRKSLRCVFPFSLSATMLWGWLKLVRPQLVERSEKRSKRKTNWGRPVSPSVFTRVRFSRETRASQSPIKRRRRKKMKKNVLFASLSSFTFCFHLPYRPFLWPLALSWPTQKYGLFCSLIDEFDMLWSLVPKIMILPVQR